MSEIDRMLAHYDQVLNGDPWHGDPMWPVLDRIPAKVAAARPLPEAHTIWEIVMHMIFWEGVVTTRLHGERAGLVEELNFPAMPEATEENWQKTLEELRVSNRNFREALVKLDPAKLTELTVARKRTYAEEAQGIIEHHLYHLGQIAMLRKAQGKG
jgi:uncharacterized damage-inducible protein DinB